MGQYYLIGPGVDIVGWNTPSQLTLLTNASD